MIIKPLFPTAALLVSLSLPTLSLAKPPAKGEGWLPPGLANQGLTPPGLANQGKTPQGWTLGGASAESEEGTATEEISEAEAALVEE